jgi:hypothetical protein
MKIIIKGIEKRRKDQSEHIIINMNEGFLGKGKDQLYLVILYKRHMVLFSFT